MLGANAQMIKKPLQVSTHCMMWTIFSAALNKFSSIGYLWTLLVGLLAIIMVILISRKVHGLSFIIWSIPVMALIMIFFSFSLRQSSDEKLSLFFIILLITALITSVAALAKRN